MDTGTQNEIWANKLIDALIGQGVNYFSCAPGSRSLPLMLAVAGHPSAKSIMHFDERGAGFHAVGYGKAAGKPAVVVATSGTAVGNLMPAVMEAFNERVPLILLTADRPPELRDCGANQTCDQVRLFANLVRWQVDLPCPEERISDHYLASTINQAVALSRSSPSGPVHINCMFREPLFSEPIERRTIAKHVSFTHPELHPRQESVDAWAKTLATKRQGIIVAASNTADQLEAIFALAETLQWPIFADILAAPRGYEDHPLLITHFDPILKWKGATAVDAVIQFGDRLVSKTLAQWLAKQNLAFHLHLSDHPERQDPGHLVTHRIFASPSLFVHKLLQILPGQQENSWSTQWKVWDESCNKTLVEFFDSQMQLTEPGIIHHMASFLGSEWALFLANSMPIRDANQFFSPQTRSGPIFGNRGVSGIDGNIATAAGIAQGCGKPMFALIGDLALLHDLNSLNYLNKTDQPVVICVVNNSGGGIFSFLPIAKRKECFEDCVATAHGISFQTAAQLFSVPYFHPQIPADFSELLSALQNKPRSCLIEITTDRAENVRVHEQILNQLGTCLNSARSIEETLAFLH